MTGLVMWLPVLIVVAGLVGMGALVGSELLAERAERGLAEVADDSDDE